MMQCNRAVRKYPVKILLHWIPDIRGAITLRSILKAYGTNFDQAADSYNCAGNQ